MLIKEFEKLYYKPKSVIVEDDEPEFTYDELIELEDGSMIKVVYDEDSNQIRVEDIITLTEGDFIEAYPAKASLEMYKQYLSNFIILQGEEALTALRDAILASQTKIDKFADIAEGII